MIKIEIMINLKNKYFKVKKKRKRLKLNWGCCIRCRWEWRWSNWLFKWWDIKYVDAKTRRIVNDISVRILINFLVCKCHRHDIFFYFRDIEQRLTTMTVEWTFSFFFSSCISSVRLDVHISFIVNYFLFSL